jgi:hypothetical protein
VSVSDASAEKTEEVGDYGGVCSHGSAVLVLQRERKGENTGKILEGGPGAFAQIDEVGVREREVADIALAPITARDHQTVGSR